MNSRREAIREACQGKEEVHDHTPIEIPGNSQRPLSLKEEMQRYVRLELSRNVSAAGEESFEEADDFEINDEDPDLTSPYTVNELFNEKQPYQMEGNPTDEDKEAETTPLDEQGFTEDKKTVLSNTQEQENSQTDPRAQFTEEQLEALRSFLRKVG